MQKSATLLGQEFGLSGEEMNRVLVKLGFLTGDEFDEAFHPEEMA